MTRTIPTLGVLALALVACATVSSATPSTVTHKQPAPCSAQQVRAEIEPGDHPNAGVWDGAVVLTNLGPDVCAIAGASELDVTGDGRSVTQVTTNDVMPWDLVVLAPGERASMSMRFPTSGPDCLRGGGAVDVSLPGDGAPATVATWLPPVC